MLLGITEDCSKQRLKENIAFMDYLFEEFLLDTLTLMINFDDFPWSGNGNIS